MSVRTSAIFIRALFLGVVAVFLIFKTKKTNKIKEKLKNFTFKDFELFFTKFMDYQFDTNYIGMQHDKNIVLYFVNHKNKINIEFELLHQKQIPFYNKLLQYAKENTFKTKKITYQHKIDFDDTEQFAPVLQIISNLTTAQAINESKKIFQVVFNCDEQSTFNIIA